MRPRQPYYANDARLMMLAIPYTIIVVGLVTWGFTRLVT